MQMAHVGLGDTNIPSRWDGLLHFTPRFGATKMASRWDAGVGWAFRWGVPVGRVGMFVSRWDGLVCLCPGGTGGYVCVPVGRVGLLGVRGDVWRAGIKWMRFFWGGSKLVCRLI